MSIFTRRKKTEKKLDKREKKNKHKWFVSKKGFSDTMSDGLTNKSVTSFSSCIDLTLLDPRTTSSDIENLCSIAFKNRYYSVVVPPIFVEQAKKIIKEKYSDAIKVCSVVGFPLGNSLPKNRKTARGIGITR